MTSVLNAEPELEIDKDSDTEPQKHPETSEMTFSDRIKNAYQFDPQFSDQKFLSQIESGDNLYYKNGKVLVPDYVDLRKECIAEHHSSPYRGHFGVKKTLKAIQTHFTWSGISLDVENFVKCCDSCQKNKVPAMLPAGLLQPLQIPEETWASVSMDFITQLPMTTSGKDAIVVFVDRLSKMAHFAATNSTVSAEETAKIFAREVWRLHGVPLEIITDRGPQFTGHFTQTLCQLIGTKSRLSTAFHPESDGQTERMNRILEDALRHFVSPTQTNWDEFLTPLEFAVNSAWQASTNESPFVLNYGKLPRTPASMQLSTEQKIAPKAHAFLDKLRCSVSQARQCIQIAVERQKRFADAKRKEVECEVGQKVLLSSKNIRYKNPGIEKLMPKYIGPFEVTERIGPVVPVAYRLLIPQSLKVHDVFHVNLLREYRTDGSYQPPPPTILFEGETEHEVDCILMHRLRKVSARRQVLEFFVHWTGYGPEHDTWEP